MRLRAAAILAVAVAVAATVACSGTRTDPHAPQPAASSPAASSPAASSSAASSSAAASPAASSSAAAASPAAASAPAAAASPPEPAAASAAEPGATRREVRVVVLGDSLSAGDGLPAAEAYPAVLERLLLEKGLPVRIQNAGVSGDTSAGGLARLDWLLRQEPDVLVLELGANDGLRGLPLEGTESNLRAILDHSREAGVRTILTGMMVPGNMGSDYARGFAAMYPRLAEGTGTPLVPFLLEGVALVPELNLPDGIHPTAAGHEILARNVLPILEPIVREEAAEAR